MAKKPKPGLNGYSGAPRIAPATADFEVPRELDRRMGRLCGEALTTLEALLREHGTKLPPEMEEARQSAIRGVGQNLDRGLFGAACLIAIGLAGIETMYSRDKRLKHPKPATAGRGSKMQLRRAFIADEILNGKKRSSRAVLSALEKRKRELAKIGLKVPTLRTIDADLEALSLIAQLRT